MIIVENAFVFEIDKAYSIKIIERLFPLLLQDSLKTYHVYGNIVTFKIYGLLSYDDMEYLLQDIIHHGRLIIPPTVRGMMKSDLYSSVRMAFPAQELSEEDIAEKHQLLSELNTSPWWSE